MPKEMRHGIELFDLTGRSAIVTGATKGLGRAMAEGLASAGADVMVTSRHAQEAQSVAAEIAQTYGRQAVGVKSDVSRPEDVDAMVDRAISEFEKIDILINNAGINIRGLINELSYEEFRQVQQINVDGVWLCCRAVIPHMTSAGYGRIINIASALAVIGLAGRSAYAASKGAVAQLTKVLALEVAPHGVTCNAICPGPFLTPLNEPIVGSEEVRKFITGATALGRWGRLEEIQGAAIFLASDASSYVTGSLLSVDGGWTAR
ncbi:MAG: SDR family NAD(P)-dependent oxidoreductase [Acidobacteriota bacterium]